MNVALSRAKIGMFIIGSKETLTMKEGPLGNWTKFFELLDENKCVDRVFKTQCEKHDLETNVANLNDFDKVKNGGCNLICNNRKKCGHSCTQNCHKNDCEVFKCLEPCQKIATGCTAEIKHKCKDNCQEDCSQCKEPTIIKINCGHDLSVQC